MSRLQQSAKPLIVPLLTGQWPHLGAAEQQTLAAWAAMFTMVVELLDPQTNAHTFADRQAFSIGQKPLARISHTVEPAFDFDVCLA
jgi:hypothetical protein